MPNQPYPRPFSIGQTINELRTARGMTLRQMGDLLGVSPQAVHKWEHGINCPDIALIPRLAQVLDVPIGVLFGEEKLTTRVAEKKTFLYICKKYLTIWLKRATIRLSKEG